MLNFLNILGDSLVPLPSLYPPPSFSGGFWGGGDEGVSQGVSAFLAQYSLSSNQTLSDDRQVIHRTAREWR